MTVWNVSSMKTWLFIELDLADREGMAKLFAEQKFDRVIHLAAQAGVRYSIDNQWRMLTATLLAT